MEPKQIAQSVLDQFVTVIAAPVPFLAAVIASWFIIRWYIRGQFDTQLNNGKSTIELLERQLQEYKDKTGGDTPDAVKTRIDALEQRIAEMVPKLAAMGPRKVAADQRQLMVPLLDPFKDQCIEIASDAASADAAQMSKGLVAAFNSAGWITQTSMVMGIGNPPPTGVGLTVDDTARLTPAQSAVAGALNAAGIAFDLRSGPMRMRPHMDGRPVPIAEIVLTTRLED